MAMYSHDTFFTAFSNRVQRVGLGGLTLRNVTAVDAGNYTIEINGRHDLFAHQTIILRVSGLFNHKFLTKQKMITDTISSTPTAIALLKST